MARNFRKSLKVFFLNVRKSLENKNYFTFENTSYICFLENSLYFFKAPGYIRDW